MTGNTGQSDWEGGFILLTNNNNKKSSYKQTETKRFFQRPSPRAQITQRPAGGRSAGCGPDTPTGTPPDRDAETRPQGGGLPEEGEGERAGEGERERLRASCLLSVRSASPRRRLSVCVCVCVSFLSLFFK